ncbi:putative sulfate permease (SulP) [Desulfamplus magnetovallimortis]|uniref:Putative sulfate permease (SulP) n=1 Tax=Desulfamplus magnetovallimortis TaxID=1246637 RepID=A0A1W1HIG4_9BACT|nr:putative sulfate/molybdate transporter [Desulfamplus magnetovallimortis]SLM32259.1 putative sulfate permease (SulP) [Desulfamplus magnetovallimortis]
MSERFKFNRLELAGALGDLGTLLPIAIAMILFNGLNAMGLFLSIGFFYIASGFYFGITVPVQPMKVIGAYAIATAMSADQILASSLLMGIFLLIVGLTGAIDLIQKATPKSVIRGVQLSTGALLISGGVKFMMGTSTYQTLQQAVEPHLAIQAVGPIPISLLIGALAAVVTLLLLDNKKYPAGLVVVAGGVAVGILLGARFDIGGALGIHIPEFLPFGFPGKVDFTFALFALVLPQLPMTLGNAVLAYTDLSKEYFGERSAKVTNRNACVSMAFANFFSFLLGGMPLCHGAGGLAAHYRFGAKTAGSNVMIGGLFLALALILGNDIVGMFNLLPMSILGVLLVFAGAQLTLTIMDLETRKDYFVATLILGITLSSNLAAGFIAGMIVGRLLKWEKLSV